MTGFIYKITNRVNNKVYIGQTRFSVEQRFKQHIKNYTKEHRNQPLYLAFAKYGIENFSVEPIEEIDTSKLDEREIYWIAKYDSFNNGYNATIGGKGGRLIYWTDSQYEEIRTLYLSGFTSKKIAELFNCSSWTIIQILKSLRVKIKGNPLDMNNFEKQEFIKSYNNGTSIKELARQYNTSFSVIKNFLIKNNVDLRVHSELVNNEELQENLVKEFLNNVTFKDLELKYHTDIRTIKRILTIHGINYKNIRSSGKTKGRFWLTDSQCLEVIEQYCAKNLSIQDIAKNFEINISTIYELLKKYGINNRRYNHSKSVQTSKDEVKMYSDNTSNGSEIKSSD